MTFGKNLLFAAAILGLSTPLLATGKTLFEDGVRAGLYGDLSVDKGAWRFKESYSAFRLKTGIQLISVGFVGVTVGFQKVGFYTLEKNWTKGDESKTSFDYRGPVEEIHLFPDAMFGFSIAAHQGEGFSFTRGSNATSFGMDCPSEDKPCSQVKTERSRLRVNEFSAQVNYNFSRGLQLFVGSGTRHVVGQPQYAAFRPYIDHKKVEVMGDYWETFNQPKWKMDTSYYMIGIRGSTL